jgi:hypothetical protein
MPDQGADLPRVRLLGRSKKLLDRISSSRIIVFDGELSEGGLNSVDLVSLMAAIEGESDLVILISDITARRFQLYLDNRSQRPIPELAHPDPTFPHQRQ